VFHHEVMDAAIFAHVVQRADVGMRQRRHCARFE
jgi:hypothetical protein